MKQGLSLVALLCAACAQSQARSFFHSDCLVPRGQRELLPSQQGTWTRRRPRRGSNNCLLDEAGDLGTAASLAVRLRGGADTDDDDDFKEEDFVAPGAGNRVLYLWQRTPYLTKRFFYATAALAVVNFFFYGNTDWPEPFHLNWGKVLKGQIWRPLTAIMNFGPFGMSSVLSAYFLWHYMGDLERMYYKKPADFAMLLSLGAACLLAVTAVGGIDPSLIGHSFSCYMVYIWSRVYEGQQVDVMGMFMLQAELLPFFFILQTVVLEGVWPTLDIVGLFVGYVYMQLKIRGKMHAPGFIKAYFQRPSVVKAYKLYEKDFGGDVMFDGVVPDVEESEEESAEGSEEGSDAEPAAAASSEEVE